MAATSVRIPADVSQLAGLRDFIRDAAGSTGASQQVVDDLVTAVDESVTNIIIHGYRGAEGTVEIGVDVADGALVVRLQDSAPPFDPTGVPDADTTLPLGQRAPGGLGIFLTRSLADGVTYQRTARGNELTLVKAKGGPTC